MTITSEQGLHMTKAILLWVSSITPSLENIARRSNKENREMSEMSEETPQCKDANFGFLSIRKLHSAREATGTIILMVKITSKKDLYRADWHGINNELMAWANNPIFHFASNQYNNYCNFYLDCRKMFYRIYITLLNFASLVCPTENWPRYQLNQKRPFWWIANSLL